MKIKIKDVPSDGSCFFYCFQKIVEEKYNRLFSIQELRTIAAMNADYSMYPEKPYSLREIIYGNVWADDHMISALVDQFNIGLHIVDGRTRKMPFEYIKNRRVHALIIHVNECHYQIVSINDHYLESRENIEKIIDHLFQKDDRTKQILAWKSMEDNNLFDKMYDHQLLL